MKLLAIAGLILIILIVLSWCALACAILNAKREMKDE